MKKTFECGCVIDHLDHESINFECPATWDIFDRGLTMGVFQLEKPLGRTWSKKLAPSSIVDVSDLISLIRPGCLNSGMTEKYRKVKWDEELPSYLHEDLRSILEPTNSCLVYQEQCMEISRKLAGFSLQEADVLRKAIGKKKDKLMQSLKSKFIDGCVGNGHEKEVAETIFGWIEESAEYSFNKSHGLSYAYLSYATAYYKTHFTKQFFQALLEFTQYEQKPREQIKLIETEAKLWNIGIIAPHIDRGNWNFEIDDNGNIEFGLGHIKGMTKKSEGTIKHFVGLANMEEFMRQLAKYGVTKEDGEHNLTKTEVEALIKCGALDNYDDGLTRNEKLKLFNLYRILNDGEKANYAKYDGRLIKFLKRTIKDYDKDGKRKRRIPTIKNAMLKYDSAPSACLPKQIIKYEEDLIGFTPSGTLADYNKNDKFTYHCHCIDLPKLMDKTPVILKVVLKDYKKYTSKKNGSEMVFMTLSDSSYTLDSCVMFSKQMDEYYDSLEKGQVLLVKGKKSRTSMIVEKLTFL